MKSVTLVLELLKKITVGVRIAVDFCRSNLATFFVALLSLTTHIPHFLLLAVLLIFDPVPLTPCRFPRLFVRYRSTIQH